MGATLGPEQVVMHPSTVKEEIKHHYLEFLRERGLVGLYEFLCTFITTLAVRLLSLPLCVFVVAFCDCRHENRHRSCVVDATSCAVRLRSVQRLRGQAAK